MLRGGVMQDSAPSELPLIAKMWLLAMTKEQERAVLMLRRWRGNSLGDWGKRGGRQCAAVIQSLPSPHIGTDNTSLQAKRSCNSFCTKSHLFVQRCTSLASQAKLQGTLQWWSSLQTMLNWVAAFIAWASEVPHVGRGQRTYCTQVSAFAWCWNQTGGRNVPALPPWLLPFSMFILEHKDSQDKQPGGDKESWCLYIPKSIPMYFVHGEDEA